MVIPALFRTSFYTIVMGHFENVLESKEGKEALGAWLLTFIKTRDADKAWDAMIETGKNNGALLKAEVGALADILQPIIDNLSKK